MSIIQSAAPLKIGMLGGGQLGLMTAQAAHKLGMGIHVYAPPEGDNIAFREADRSFVGSYADQAKLEQFATSLGPNGVVSIESENVPASTLRFLQQFVSVAPSPELLEVSQNRLREKDLANKLGIATAPYGDMHALMKECRVFELLPGRLKTHEGGYDGKGQKSGLVGPCDAYRAWAELERVPCIIESEVAIAYELSVIVARNRKGTRFYPAVVNEHEDGILRTTIYEPGLIPATIVKKAMRAAFLLARHFDLCGLLAVEFFVTKEGELLFNEMAPRPHNSAHWSIEGCETSQFTNFVLAITGLPLRDPVPLGPTMMINLIGRAGMAMADHHIKAGAAVHLYGKKEERPDRKMGHATYRGSRFLFRLPAFEEERVAFG